MVLEHDAGEWLPMQDGLPVYYDADGKPITRVTEEDAKRFKQALRDAGVSGLEARIYCEVFSAEGGFAVDASESDNPDEGARIGVTKDTIQKMFKDIKIAPKLEAIGIHKDTNPKDLTIDQVVAFNRIYLRDVVGPVKANKAGTDDAFEYLQREVKDGLVIGAFVDTAIREGGPGTAKIVQLAINRANETLGLEARVEVKGGIGSQTIAGMATLAATIEGRNAFLEALAAERIASRPNSENLRGESMRANRWLPPLSQ